MNDWIFNEEDEWEQREEPQKPTSSDPSDEETLIGRDAAGIVAVHVTPKAAVVAVKLAKDWKGSVEPRDFHTHVVAAANNATTHALTKQLESDEGTTPDSAARNEPEPDVSHYNKDDVSRLLDAVTTDLDQFMQQLSSIVDQPASAESSGRHVSGSAQRGRFLDLTIDEAWVNAARHTEIESELLDVLQQLGRKSSPGELEKGPQSSAITELNTLAQDPQKLMRALGLPSQPPQ